LPHLLPSHHIFSYDQQQLQSHLEAGDQQELSEIFSIFGDRERLFAIQPADCQILVSIIIIAKLSFWIDASLQLSVAQALYQYKQKGYIQKLKTDITADLLHYGHKDLVTLLYRKVTHIDG